MPATIDHRRLSLRLRAGLVATAAGLTLAAAPSAHAGVVCDKVASPTGSDTAAGTLLAPYKTAQKLADSLNAGQTGCFRAGTYSGGLRINKSGASGSPITLASFPGELGTIAGRVYIPDGKAFWTFTQLKLDRSSGQGSLPSPTVLGDDISFIGNDVTDNHTGICFDLGNKDYGHASRILIQGNRIHNCGIMPSANHDHGIYVEDSDNVVIQWNLIYGNAD